ncbi:MAG TPA: cytochrome P450 [Candidatus Binatia bacterium]|jgi:cytochrome P450|nr:cytochrome P450 [Candidatus Binatia bacterium]
MDPDLSHVGDARIFLDRHAYADQAAWHAAAERLRRYDPLPLVTVDGYVPFRPVTRHADVACVERNHTLFWNTRDSVLLPREQVEKGRALGMDIKTLIHMDGTEHRNYRQITNDWFKPASLRKEIGARLPVLARRFVDRMLAHDGECDFVRDIALYYPLHVILSILGVPETDEPRMLELTQKVFGGEDPDVGGEEGKDSVAIFMAALADMAMYFQRITDERRAHPTSDLASTIANGTIAGAPLGDLETAGYYSIVATAGHDTTSSTLAGGLEALIRSPEQLQALKDDPSKIPNAVCEMIRWVTPVRHFMRQAQGDYRLGDVQLHAGDWLLMSYLSANRDEAVFADPMRFDIGRKNADDHLAFGIGVHFCLGAHLARMELEAFFRELLPRLDAVELAGPSESMATTFVGGPKRMPIRYTVRPGR